MSKIVVGVDCLDNPELATERSPELSRAVEEARSHGSQLEVIAVWTYPPLTLEEKLRVAAGLVEKHTAEVLHAEISKVLGDGSAVDLNVEVIQGAPGRVLVEASESADLLVVGRNDEAKLRHFVLGSVGSQCVRHASCPTMVVPRAESSSSETQRIVVGVDGSENSTKALSWALNEASIVGASEVHIVNVWREPLSAAGELADSVQLLAMMEDSANQIVDAYLANAQVPDGVKLTGSAERGDPSAKLVAESEGADLVVVGSRGRGGFKGLLLGSVSRNTLHRASCPVVVIPPSAEIPSLVSDVTE